MGAFVINSAGLGEATASDLAAPCVAFGYASYLSNPSCWLQSYDYWQAQYYGPGLNIPVPNAVGTPATALSDPNAVLADTTGQISQDLSNAQLGAAQAAVVAQNPATSDACQNFSANWPWPFAGLDCASMFLWGAGLLAAVWILPKVLHR